MATRVIMPTLGLTMEQGTVVRWLKREGDAVEREEPLFTVETDKATMDVGAPAAGILARVLVAAGVAVPVLETIALITTPGEELPADAESDGSPGGSVAGMDAGGSGSAAGVASGGQLPATAPPEVVAAPVARIERGAGREGWPASPRARRVAAELGVELAGVQGSGPDGRIVEADVRRHAAGQRAGGARATPLAQRLALELGVDLATVRGSGPAGRIQREDVEATARSAPPAASPAAQLAAALASPTGTVPAEQREQPAASAATPAPAPRVAGASRLATLGRLRRVTAERMALSACTGVRATPLAQRLALELGVDLATVRGSGPAGRIQREDVEATARSAPPAASPAAQLAAVLASPTGKVPAEQREQPAASAATPAPAPRVAGASRLATLGRLRRVTAERMALSARTVARVTLFAEIDFAEAVRFRAQLAPEFERRYTARLTVDTLIARACALALAEHPALNAHWTDEGPRLFDQVDVGVAVALPDGLLVPVVRDVARRPLWEIARALNDNVARAQEGRLGPDDFGGTFTVTSLGRYGVEGFTPIVNPPEVAILGVGAIQPRPVAVDGAVVVRERVTLSLAFDHRAVDGAPAAEFLARVREALEKPYILLT